MPGDRRLMIMVEERTQWNVAQLLREPIGATRAYDLLATVLQDFTDWTYLGQTNFLLYTSEEFNAGSRIEGGLRIGYAGNNGEWELAAFARNITDEDNVLGVVDFNNNTAFVNDPRVFGVSFNVNY